MGHAEEYASHQDSQWRVPGPSGSSLAKFSALARSSCRSVLPPPRFGQQHAAFQSAFLFLLDCVLWFFSVYSSFKIVASKSMLFFLLAITVFCIVLMVFQVHGLQTASKPSSQCCSLYCLPLHGLVLVCDHVFFQFFKSGSLPQESLTYPYQEFARSHSSCCVSYFLWTVMNCDFHHCKMELYPNPAISPSGHSN